MNFSFPQRQNLYTDSEVKQSASTSVIGGLYLVCNNKNDFNK